MYCVHWNVMDYYSRKRTKFLTILFVILVIMPCSLTAPTTGPYFKCIPCSIFCSSKHSRIEHACGACQCEPKDTGPVHIHPLLIPFRYHYCVFRYCRNRCHEYRRDQNGCKTCVCKS